MIPKFRVWHHELGRMMSIKNMWFQEGVVEELELNDTVMNDYITSYPDEVTIMQSTGLKDKNGKEIFEGDLITSKAAFNSVVKYGKWRFIDEYEVKDMGIGFYLDNSSNGETKYSSLDYDYINRMFEVVGNVYENEDKVGFGK